MEEKPYIRYPKPYQPGAAAEVSGTPFINEPGQVSFGVNDFKPGLFRALHGHHTWELVLVDSSSEGPGYVYFDGRWWRVAPGGAVFVPKGSAHSWSSGNTTGFRMIWIYGGSREEAGRIWHSSPRRENASRPRRRGTPGCGRRKWPAPLKNEIVFRPSLKGGLMALEGLYFEDFSPGKIFPTHRRTITETDLVNFMTLCGFYESLFMDQGYVETETAFARRIVPGALTLSYAEGLSILSGILHHTGMAFLGMELTVLKPVFVGDTIGVEIEVTEKRQATNQCPPRKPEFCAPKRLAHARS